MTYAGGQLWVDKWHPKTSADLVGNQSAIKTLRDWLRVWDANKKNNQKALLISGPPGIGKTSSVILICRELGFEPVEVNASDARGKSDSSTLEGVGGKLANIVKELVTNRKLSFNTNERKKLCLVMDEVDGMSTGDRGGVADLVDTIKNTRIPRFCDAVTRPLLKGKDGIDSTISLMREYGINREDVDFITDVTKFKSLNTTDPWKSIETKVKSAFTRAYNKQHIKSRVAGISTDILSDADGDNII